MPAILTMNQIIQQELRAGADLREARSIARTIGLARVQFKIDHPERFIEYPKVEPIQYKPTPKPKKPEIDLKAIHAARVELYRKRYAENGEAVSIFG